MKRTNKRTSRMKTRKTRKTIRNRKVRFTSENSNLSKITRRPKFRLTRKRGYTKHNSAGMFHTKWQVENQSIGIGPLKKNKLTKYGYHFDIIKKDRAAALSKAIKEYGALSVYRSLNAIAVYNKNTHPEMAKVAKEDRDMIREKFF